MAVILTGAERNQFVDVLSLTNPEQPIIRVMRFKPNDQKF
jgi:hypothetical protein